MIASPFEKRPNPWEDVERHVGRYGAPYFIPEIIDHAEGSYVYTESGRKILDFTSGQMSSTLGHNNPDVVKTIRETIGRLDHLYSGMLSRPSINLCTRIAMTAPEPLSKVIPLSTGSEVNEAAIRMAKTVTGKFEIVSFSRSWHGLTEASAGATYSSARKLGVPGAPGQLAIPTPYEYIVPTLSTKMANWTGAGSLIMVLTWSTHSRLVVLPPVSSNRLSPAVVCSFRRPDILPH